MYGRMSPFAPPHGIVGPTDPMSSMMTFAPIAIPSCGLTPIVTSDPPAFPEVEVLWPEGHPPALTLSLCASGSPPVQGSIPRYGLIGMYRTSFRRVMSVVL